MPPLGIGIAISDEFLEQSSASIAIECAGPEDNIVDDNVAFIIDDNGDCIVDD